MNENDLTPTIQTDTAVAAAKSRRVIEIGDGELHRWVDESWEAVTETNSPDRPEVLLHGNDLVRLADGRLAPFNEASFRERLSRVAAYSQPTGSGPKPKQPPSEVVRALLSREQGEYPNAAVIERITDVPLVTESGVVLDRPGYYAEDGIFYQPAAGLDDLKLPDEGEVEPDDLDAARDFLLDDWFGEFGFADEASKANALALLLTPFMREFVKGGVPMFPIQASQYGWGKSLITDACFVPSCGIVAKAPGTGSEEEMRKRITSTLREVPSAVVIDNVSGRLDSGALANVLTTGKWKDRILGESRDLEIEPRCVWSVNGNNFTMSAELVERCPAPIQLGDGAYWQALCERKEWDPTLRPREQAQHKYDHPEFREWAQENRGRAIEAAFVLIRHWLDGPAQVMPGGHTFYRPGLSSDEEERRVEAVRPDHDTGEFPEWQRVVGGILKAAGVGGFRENYEGWSSSTDEEGEEIGAFFAAWHELGRPPLEMSEVESLCQYGNPLREMLPLSLAEVRADKLTAKLKAWLRDHKDTRYRGYRLVVQPGRKNLYSIQG